MSEKYTHFLSYFELGEMGLELGYTHLYYSLHKDRVQVIREFKVADDYSPYCDDEMSLHILPNIGEPLEVHSLLESFLKEYLIHFVKAGIPYYSKSDVFTELQWGGMLKSYLKYQDRGKTTT